MAEKMNKYSIDLVLEKQKKAILISDEVLDKIRHKFNELAQLLALNNIAIIDIDNQEKWLYVQKLNRENFKEYEKLSPCYPDKRFSVHDISMKI